MKLCITFTGQKHIVLVLKNCSTSLSNQLFQPSFMSTNSAVQSIEVLDHRPLDLYFQQLMLSRGYSYGIPATVRQPSDSQLRDYDNDLVWAVRTSNLEKVKCLAQDGKDMTACNKYSESIMHMACRRSSFEMVKLLHEHGARFDQVDDFGRTPMHDACWRAQPHFGLIEYILDRQEHLLRSADTRGFTPLKYVQKAHWEDWRTFLFNHRDKYWACMKKENVLTPDESNGDKQPFDKMGPINSEAFTASAI